MPLDGTIYGADQLRDAKEHLLEYGWCAGHRFKLTGERCALGVLDAISGEMVSNEHPAVQRLAAAIPQGWTCYMPDPAYRVACFNNEQPNLDAIIEWFDRAINL